MSWHVVPSKPYVFTLTMLPPAALAGVPHTTTALRGQVITVVRNDYATWLTLRARGLVLPAPVTGWTWPGRFQPRQHQQETVGFFLEHERGFCTDGLGTGKTLSVIWALDYLLRQGEITRALIVAPKTILHQVWARELLQTLPHHPWVILDGPGKRRRQVVQADQHAIMVTNPEGLDLIESVVDVDVVVVDEFTKFKNYRAQRSRTLRRVADGKRLWMLSGTPTPETPLDAYGPVKIVRPTWQMGFLRWRDLTMSQLSKFKWVPKPGVEKVIAAHMRPCIRHKREDCYDIPAVDTITLPIELTPMQETALRTLKEEARVTLAGQTITAANAAATLTKALQVMAGGVYTREDARGRKQVVTVDAAPLYDTVLDLVQQADGPVLIYTSFKSATAVLVDYLTKHELRVASITGDVSAVDRQRVFQQFEHGQLDALVAVSSTMSHGVDRLQYAGHYIVWMTPPYAAGEYEQANGRLIRDGQKNAVSVYHLVAHKVAQTLFERLNSKLRLQDAVLDLLEVA